jgi:tRNA pseudouridine13 synthase
VGHLAGNRFEVRVRGCKPHARKLAERTLEVLARRGVPNWFDYQRFGRRADNHVLGRALVLGRHKEFCDEFLGRPSNSDSPRLAAARSAYDAGNLAEAKKLFTGCPDQLRVLFALAKTRSPVKAAGALPKQLTRLLVGAFQSDIFNAVLERRVETIDRVEMGDLAYIHPPQAAGPNVAAAHGQEPSAVEAPDPLLAAKPEPKPGPHPGAVFLVEFPEVEAARAARFEISPTGPIVGHRVTLASGRPGELERDVLAEKGIAPADFERVKALRLRGDRRPLRVPLSNVAVEPVGDDIVVRFTLPPGAYATIVMGEIMK